MPKHHAWRNILNVEKIQPFTQLSVIALLCFLDSKQIILKCFFISPGGAIDALQHLVVRVSSPVGACDLGELERFELPRVGNMRPSTKVDEFTLLVKRKDFIAWDAFEDLYFVVLTLFFKQRHRFVARHFRTSYRLRRFGELEHLFLNFF